MQIKWKNIQKDRCKAKMHRTKLNLIKFESNNYIFLILLAHFDTMLWIYRTQHNNRPQHKQILNMPFTIFHGQHQLLLGLFRLRIGAFCEFGFRCTWHMFHSAAASLSHNHNPLVGIKNSQQHLLAVHLRMHDEWPHLEAGKVDMIFQKCLFVFMWLREYKQIVYRCAIVDYLMVAGARQYV